MFSFSLFRPKGADAHRSIGRSLPSLGLFACAIALVSAGCGGSNSTSGTPSGGDPVVIGSPSEVANAPRLGVEGARGEISFVASPNATPVALDDFRIIKASATETAALNYPATYTLLAPEIWADRRFKEWQLNGTAIETDNILQLSQIPASLNGTVRAVYEPYVAPNGIFLPNYAADLEFLAQFQTLPIRVWIDPLLAPNDGARQLLRNGMDKWVKASGGVIDFVEVQTAGAADIRLRSADNLLNVGEGVLGVALSFVQADSLNNDLDYSTVWLIRAQSAAQNASERLSYEATVAHEIGHALGIQGHSENENDLMNPFSGPLELTENDINTVATAYKVYFNGGNTVPTR